MEFFPPPLFYESGMSSREQELHNSIIYPNAAELLQQQQNHLQNHQHYRMLLQQHQPKQQQRFAQLHGSSSSSSYQLPRLHQQYQVMSGAYHKTPMDNWSNPSPIAAVQSWQLQAQQQQQQQQQQLAPLGRTYEAAQPLVSTLGPSITLDDTSIDAIMDAGSSSSSITTSETAFAFDLQMPIDSSSVTMGGSGDGTARVESTQESDLLVQLQNNCDYHPQQQLQPIQHHHLLQIEHQLQLDSSFTAAATGNNTHYLQDSLQLAHFITSVVFILWRSRSLSESASAFVQFQNYVLKLLRSTSNNVTPPVILTSLKYIERLRSVTPCSPTSSSPLSPSSIPSHDDSVSGSGSPGTELRIWVTALSIADAFVNDNAYTVRSWAEVSGFSAIECATMRKEFLEAIDHRLYIAEAEYANWLHALEAMLDQSCADNAAYSIMSPLSALDNCSYAPTTGTTSVTTTMASTLYDHIPLDPLTLRLPGSFPVDLSPAMPIATVVGKVTATAAVVCPETTGPVLVSDTSAQQPLSHSQISMSWPHSISQFAAVTMGDAVLGRRIRL
ncbi:hypothetical protein BASA50_001931 [Batrachochytrium salamandrivorans]|uniref:Cyclin N-terminal domain-containing protein n=1 Tax=Batrachochytrium salamandrivorans TaxID=1357716 RepID=A0ABQ8FML8_9FUNG|nr:hypothetical protein BASA50_001931 [Batrachochytrium salamandrivorans]KAH9246388.1 hypothetical protein BASA81_016078 [Batrachochytrium salamandrivorans]